MTTKMERLNELHARAKENYDKSLAVRDRAQTNVIEAAYTLADIERMIEQIKQEG